jgi:hypothetical protein
VHVLSYTHINKTNYDSTRFVKGKKKKKKNIDRDTFQSHCPVYTLPCKPRGDGPTAATLTPVDGLALALAASMAEWARPNKCASAGTGAVNG